MSYGRLEEEAPPSSTRFSASPPPHFLIQEPDGSLNVAVREADEGKFAEAAAEPPPTSHIIFDGALFDEGNFDSYELMLQIRHIRHKKSFLFLLVLDFLYFLLLLLAHFSTKYVDDPDSVEDDDPSANTTAANPPVSFLICVLVIDVIGFVGTYRKSINMLTFFVVVEGLSSGIYTLAEFSPLIILRLIIFLLALQVRAGLLREQLFAEENGIAHEGEGQTGQAAAA